MMRKVKPTAVKIITQTLSNMQSKSKLRCFRKNSMQAIVMSNRSVRDRTYHWHKLAFELAKQFADQGGGHALISVFDVRISNMLVRGKVRGIFPAQIQRSFEIGYHGQKIVRRSRPCPRVVRS